MGILGRGSVGEGAVLHPFSHYTRRKINPNDKTSIT
jgi:hypothetical protein